MTNVAGPAPLQKKTRRRWSALALLAFALTFGVRGNDGFPFAASPSPDGTEVPPAAQIVDAVGAVWTLAADLRVLRNGVHAASGYGRLINYSQQTIFVYGGDSRWWQWTGSGWTLYNPVATSPSGTAVPPASQIVDDGGNVWTLATDRRVLRNGAHAGGGYSNSMVWVNQSVYVAGLDGIWWYRWSGTGWVVHGQTAPGTTSPAGTRLPPATQIVDAGGAVWTLAADRRVLRDGVHAGGGYGTSILWLNQTVYVLGLDGIWWYRWSGTGWVSHGATVPVAASPAGTQVPPATQVVDAGGAVWTLAADRRVLRNGVHAGGGYSTSIFWQNQTVYVLGLDGISWYQWNGTGWVPTANQSPAVSLTAPANGATFTAPAMITITATAGDTDGTVASVEFYAGATSIGTDTTAPYSVSWNNVAAGLYSITAVARDNAGGMTVSAARDIRVDPGGLPRTAIFTASANDATAVDRYFLEIFPAGANPLVANPVATRDLGKPPVVGGECSVDVSATTVALPPGSYIATVTAIGPNGSARSAASPVFVR